MKNIVQNNPTLKTPNPQCAEVACSPCSHAEQYDTKQRIALILTRKKGRLIVCLF